MRYPVEKFDFGSLGSLVSFSLTINGNVILEVRVVLQPRAPQHIAVLGQRSRRYKNLKKEYWCLYMEGGRPVCIVAGNICWSLQLWRMGVSKVEQHMPACNPTIYPRPT